MRAQSIIRSDKPICPAPLHFFYKECSVYRVSGLGLYRQDPADHFAGQRYQKPC